MGFQKTLFDEETDKRIFKNLEKRMFGKNTGDDFVGVLIEGKRGLGMSPHSIQETSKMAFNELKDSGKQDTLEQEYIDQLWDIGEPSSDNEVNFHAGYYPDDKFGPRRRGLEKKGFISRCNKRTCKVTGKYVLTFWPTGKGLAMLGGK